MATGAVGRAAISSEMFKAHDRGCRLHVADSWAKATLALIRSTSCNASAVFIKAREELDQPEGVLEADRLAGGGSEALMDMGFSHEEGGGVGGGERRSCACCGLCPCWAVIARNGAAHKLSCSSRGDGHQVV